MNEKEYIILLKYKDKTTDVQSIKYGGSKCFVTFKYSSTYEYDKRNVIFEITGLYLKTNIKYQRKV